MNRRNSVMMSVISPGALRLLGLTAISVVNAGGHMLTVHHLNNSRSHRVLWLLERARRSHEIIRYQRQPNMLGAEGVAGDSSARQVAGDHRQRQSPSPDPRAIINYIVETYGNGRLIPPPNTPERLRYTYWLHYAEGSAMFPLLL